MLTTKKTFSPRSVVLFALAFILSFSSLTFIGNDAAASVPGWQAGNIMEDHIMADKNTMTASQIQSFLNQKTPSCDINGEQLSEYGGPDLNGDGRVQRWEWGKANYNQTKFYCLKVYGQNGKSAAEMIYEAAQQYSINPQVLLVLLQKEQGLVQDTWPLNIQYRSATGYGCPDTAPCDSDYYGLQNQLNWAATMFRAILNNSSTWYTPYELGSNYIQYSPDASCGGSTVYVKNRATQALYNYTPYQPNQGALDAGWGTAHCGAYGNRNFYLYFTSWFGSTRAVKFENLLSARWMQTKTDVYKKNPVTGESIDSVIPAGTQIYFPSKTTIDGRMYLRTQIDTQNNLIKGILYSDLEEINVTFDPLLYPRWMELKRNAKKIDPRTGQIASGYIPAGTQVYFPTKFSIGGVTYLRTQNDVEAGFEIGIPLSDLSEAGIVYEDLLYPRWMTAKANTYMYDVKSTKNVGEVIAKDTDLYFNKKITVNGVTYLHNGLPATGNFIGVPLPVVNNIGMDRYESLLRPRWMRTASDNVYKKNPMSGKNIGKPLPQNTEIDFSTKILIGDKWYLRTKTDTRKGNNYGILLSELSEIPGSGEPVVFEPFLRPRWMETTVDTYRKYPRTSENVGLLIPAGTKLHLSSKVLIDNKWYYRTTTDAMYGYTQGILATDLQDTSPPN